ncbi:tetratricopeptide repeat protein [Halorhabdus rudnickae]|uniref:tetratricopeptide repeat protein n=1 Tax=Halorhabdus rudnickae TaxID=1775544 RepID=UPI0010826D01|nr:tetratricopeptide repeat protein [Halorhabdus rudnickae]
MIETAIAAGIAANVLYEVGKKSQQELRELVNGEIFSTPMFALQEKFEESLEEALKDELSEIDKIQDTDIEDHWEGIIENINSIDPVFLNKEDAIENIAASVVTGLGFSNEEDNIVRGKIEIAVVRAYREAVTGFLQRVEEEELSTEFQNRANLRITEGVSKIEKNLRRVETRIIQQNDSRIKNEGFVRFDPLYFRRKEPDQPQIAWRRGFNHFEIEAGYAIKRERPLEEESERIDVTEDIIQQLENDEEVVVLGEPGSGKSTICKQVANEWHENNPGSVFYRQSDSVVPFRNPGTLIEAINATDEDVLVVVEDAVHEDAAILFELVSEFQHDSNVSFLFDARVSQWNSSEDAFGGPEIANLKSNVQPVRVPELDVRECSRIIEHFEDLTDEEIERSAESLYKEVNGGDYGDLLLLAYKLTGPVSTSGQYSGEISAFEYDVHQSFNDIGQADELEDVPKLLRHKVGILVNLLNASRLPVSKGFIHSIATEPEEHWSVESVLDYLEGSVIRSNQDGVGYRTFHERWSTLYLSRAYDELDIRAVNIFEDCIEALILLPENDDKIKSIQEWLSGDQPALSNMHVAPQQFAEYLTRQIGRVATRSPELSPLFISCNISFSETDSVGAEVSWASNIGLSAVYNSRYKTAEQELERGIEVLTASGDENEWTMQRRAVLLENLGIAKRKQGKLRKSWDCHKQSLSISEELDNTIGIAESLNNLGSIEVTRGIWDNARFSLQESLKLKRREGYQSGIPSTLDNLGIVERHEGNIEKSKELHKEALSIEKELGRDHEVAKTLVNLVLALIEQGDLKSAENKCKKALNIFQEIDDDHGIAQCVGNLGLLNQRRDDNREAIKKFRESFEKFIELGSTDEAIDTARNIALLYEEQDNREKIVEWCDKGEKLAESLGQNRQGDIFRKIRAGDFERR